MRNDRPPYFKIRRGRAFFELGRKRSATSGMPSSIPLGIDSDAAKASAWRLYYEWKEKSGRIEHVESKRSYPKGSVGSFFDSYRQGKAWGRKADATRREWEYCWRRFIEPAFGQRRIDLVAPAEFEEIYFTWDAEYGPKARWRAVKIARAIFNAAVNHKVITASPAKVVTNPMPKGRREVWRAAEIAKLVEAAITIGKPAMSLAIRIGWETAMQPGDVRNLTMAMRHADGSGAWFETDRNKTGTPVVSAISKGLDDDIREYVESLGISIIASQPFLRTSRDAHLYLKARFLTDFDKVRKAAFGDEETRRFQDIRRSANLEAVLADASPQERAEMLANNLDKDAFLEATYTPPTVERSRQMAKKRLLGRSALAVQSVNTECEDGN